MKDIVFVFFIGLLTILGFRVTEFKTENEIQREKIKNGSFQYCNQYYYDYKFGELDESSKRLIMRKSFNQDGELNSITSFLNENNNSQSFDPNAGVTTYYIVEIDKKNNFESITRKNSYGEIIGKKIVKINREKRIIEEFSYNEEGDFSGKVSSSYNENGELIERKEIDNYEEPFLRVYLHPNSSLDSLIYIFEYKDSSRRVNEITLDENTTRFDYVEQTAKESSVKIVNYNEFGLELLTKGYSWVGDPLFMIRTEWVRFEEQTSEPN